MNSSKHRVALTMPPHCCTCMSCTSDIQIARIPLLGKTTNSRGFAKFIQLVLVFRSLPITSIYQLIQVYLHFTMTLYISVQCE